MYFQSNLKYLLFLTLIVILGSCKKENADSVSRTELLSKAPWILKAAVLHGDNDGDGIVDPVNKDVYPTIQICSRDDLLIFHSDGTGSYDAGANLCPGTLQTINFTWTFYDPFSGTVNENVIKIKDLGFDALGIMELNTETFKAKYITSAGELIYTYSH